MDNSQNLSLTEVELKAFFDQLFPEGFAGADVLTEIAPKGWQHSPLLTCFHPSPEQMFKELLQIHNNIEEFIQRKGHNNSDQNKSSPRLKPTLDDIRAEWKDTPVNAIDEATALVGLCLWDIFSDNHDVFALDGRLIDIGSFRGASAFIDNYLRNKLEEMTSCEGDYMRFYMGTIWIRDRADLRTVYAMIFRRLKSLGANWVYYFPQIHCMDLLPLREKLQSPTIYSPSESLKVQHEEEQRQAESEKLCAKLNEINMQSKKEALDRRLPSTVLAYQQVYNRNPRGWPPD